MGNKKHNTKKNTDIDLKQIMNLKKLDRKNKLKRKRPATVKVNGLIKSKNPPKREKLKIENINIELNVKIMTIESFYKFYLESLNFYKLKPNIKIYKSIDHFNWDHLPFSKSSESGHQLYKLKIYKKYFQYILKTIKKNKIQKNKINSLTNLFENISKSDQNSFLKNLSNIQINSIKLIHSKDQTGKLNEIQKTCFFYEHPMKLDYIPLVFKETNRWDSKSLEDYFSRSYRNLNIHMEPQIKIIAHEKDESNSSCYLCQLNGMFEYEKQTKEFWIHYSLLISNPTYRKQIKQYQNKFKV